jgi:RND superfamily putative drug exporter
MGDLMSLARGISAVVCGRWTKWVVLVAWLVILGVAGPLAGKLTGVEKNDNSAWLPGSAESTKVLELQKQFQTADTIPTVIVYERKSGITPDDLHKAQDDAKAFGTSPDITGKVIGPVPSDDKNALEVIVPITVGSGGWDKLADDVNHMRDVAGKGQDGLTIHITGPGGIAADQAEAFKGIDGVLLYATLAVVVVILLLTYRSPVLWLLPVITAGTALTSSQAVIYLMAKHAGLTVNAQSAGILTVLVFGAGTDYALLLVARYREELRRHEDRHEAMAFALHRAGPAIIASAATVAAGMLCLMVAEMNSTKGLGPVAAIGIGVGLLAMITLLPALLVIFGRWLFWPVKPKFGTTDPTARGAWARVGQMIARRPRVVWVTTALILGALAFGVTDLKASGLTTAQSFVNKPDSVVGEEVLAAHFAAGAGQPVVVISKAGAATQVRDALAGTQGIDRDNVPDPIVKGDHAYLTGTLLDKPDSKAANATVDRVRTNVHQVEGADAVVGGQTAIVLDIERASTHDNQRIIPLVLLVVLVILGLLLRALVAPLILIATVVLSFATALGVSALVFDHVFGFGGADSSLPLFVFVFLVALGIDYNIFLMTRVREEAVSHGTKRGALVGLAATGGVITSAGLVLAGTFAALGTLPVVAFAEIGFAVAFGVILDTLVVRSVLVTALNLDIGRRVWWPGKLAARTDEPAVEEPGRQQEPVLVP